MATTWVSRKVPPQYVQGNVWVAGSPDPRKQTASATLTECGGFVEVEYYGVGAEGVWEAIIKGYPIYPKETHRLTRAGVDEFLARKGIRFVQGEAG